MKYFIGIIPPEETKSRINNFQRSFSSNKLPYIFEPHITVKSWGGLTDDLMWLDRVIPIIEEYPTFEICLNGVGSFRDDVVILKPVFSKELLALHKKILDIIGPNGYNTYKNFFEGDAYEAHFTLGMNSWGMTKDELFSLKDMGIKELSDIPKFNVTFLRVYRQEKIDEPYKKFIDIKLNDKK